MDVNPILDRLDKVRQIGPDKWSACCPAHDDRTPSLSIKDGGDRVLLHCFAGCRLADILAGLGLELHNLFAETRTPRQPAGVPQRKLAEALGEELHILAQCAFARSRGDELSEHDTERERIAWVRVDTARRAAQ